jgi:hypothetical protein
MNSAGPKNAESRDASVTDATDTHGGTREKLSTDEAVQRSGLSRNQITNLLRQGKLEG